MKRQSKKRLIAAAIASVPALIVTHAAMGQTWIGGDSNYWNDALNWSPNTVPDTGGTAIFASTGNNPNVSLSNTTQAIGTILFDSTPVSFNLGVDTGDTFIFDSNGAITVNTNVATLQTISASIQTTGSMSVNNAGGTNGLTLGGAINITGGGTLSVNNTVANEVTTLGGNISDSGGAGMLILSASNTTAGNNNNFIINGTNTYTGTTTITVNTGSIGSIQIGSDSAFGTNKVTVVEPTGINASQWKALGGTRTISNAMDLNSGLTFVGTNGFNFNGPINIINTGAGRTINDNASGIVATFGSTSGASTITLGNPVSNGGDDIGKTLTLNAVSGAMIVINDVMQDPSATSGGSVAPLAGGTVRFNSQSTYSGTTSLAGGNTIIEIGTSSTFTGATLTSGPFGVGSIIYNNGTNPYLEAYGADQTVANPITFLSGWTVMNVATNGINGDPGGPHNLTLSGPISYNATASKTATYETPGRIAYMGSAAGSSTLTLSTNATSINLAFDNNINSTTVMNDIIQDNVSGPATPDTISYNYIGSGTAQQGGGVWVINGPSTYGGTTTFNDQATNAASTNKYQFELGVSSVGSGTSVTSGPFGRGTIIMNATNTPPVFEPLGADRVIGNTTTLTFGFWAANTGTNVFNLTFSGPMTLGTSGRVITNNMVNGVSLNLGFATNPSTLTLGNQLTIQTQTPGGGLTVINDLVSNGAGTGKILAQNSAIVQLTNASNSYTGGDISNSFSTISVAADGDLGASSGTVSINNGRLLSTGTFSSARGVTVNGTGTNVNTIDATTTNTLDLSGVVGGAGALTKGTNTGTLQLDNAGNSYVGLVIDGGTVSVSSDGNLGNASGAVTLAAPVSGTLLSTGTFSSARTVNLNGTVNTIDATGGNTLTLTGPLSGSGDLTKGTNSGTLQLAQPSGYSLSGNVNVNGGALVVGATSVYDNSGPNGPVVISGGLTNPFNVVGAVTINNASHAALNPSVPGSGVTHSFGSLSIAANSSLDIGNHTVIVQNAPDETIIGGYLANGYNGAFWNGTSASGGSITSIVAYNDNSGSTSIGYGNVADFTGVPSPYAPTGPKALTGNQVVVQPALAGDLLLSGSVGANELSLLLASYGTTSYDGTHPNNWAYGNINYSTDGLVDANDLSLLLLNYGKTSSGFVSGSAKTAAVGHSAKTASTLTGTVAPAVNADAIELDVYLATGDVVLNGNNATDVSAVLLTSPGAGMIGGTTFTAAFNALFPSTAANATTSINAFNTFTAGSAVNGQVDMGNIYNTSLNTEDLGFEFSEKNQSRGQLEPGSVVYFGVPEPTTLSLMGLAAAGLLGRRRKSKNRQADTV